MHHEKAVRALFGNRKGAIISSCILLLPMTLPKRIAIHISLWEQPHNLIRLRPIDYAAAFGINERSFAYEPCKTHLKHHQ